MRKYICYILLTMSLLLAGCDDLLTEGISGVSEDRIIHVSGVVTDEVTVTTLTRATETTDTVRAETVDWMKGALRHGLDITYSNLDADGNHITSNQHVAILKWTGVTNPDSRRGDYTFKYKVNEADAEWYDNGPHYFEGQYVPSKIRTTGTSIDASNLVTDQSDASDYNYAIDAEGNETTTGSIGNYTLLSHYVGMPPKWTTSATVDQMLLPFKHRLARVIAYILIDPDLKDRTGLNTAILKGYSKDASGRDDASTTELRFANVKVLDYVKETAADGDDAAAALTPQWTLARRVIPHFEAELTQSVNNKQELAVPDDATDAEKTQATSGFIVYTRKRDDKLIHPREEGWYEAHKDYVLKGPNSAYTQKKYRTVPVYDVIVRPTYTSTDEVMYDEEGYYKDDKSVNTSRLADLAKEENSIEFEMTLNNDLVYTKKFEFDLNANQQTIVYITIDRESIDYDQSTSETWVSTTTTDGYYGVNNDLGHNMSLAGSSWQRAIRNSSYNPGVTDGNDYGAQENGEYVGQYVDDATWIKAFAQAYEGGEHHGDYFILDRDITVDAKLLPDNFVFTGHLDGRGHTITVTNLSTPWDEAHYQYDVITDFGNLPGTVYEKKDDDYVAFTLPTLYSANYYTQDEIDNASEEDPAHGKTTSDIKNYSLASPTIAQMMAGDTYYILTEGVYTVYVKPSALYAYVNQPIHHTSGSSLFSGLNATYVTAQETAANPFAKDAEGNPTVVWEANVHKENNGIDHWVPVAGYRAELYNVKLSGGTFFPAGTVLDGSLSNTTVNGYIYNCWEIDADPDTAISNKVPAPQW